MDDSTPTVAFVTVSYGPDRDRCALLCRSLDLLAPVMHEHWIIVDRADVDLFRPLEGERRRLLITEDVLPGRVLRLGTRRLGLRSNVFLQARGKPIRGWLVQQLVKLAVATQLSVDVIVHADSDVALVKPFHTSSLVDEADRVRLYRLVGAIDQTLPAHIRWHRAAERLLGIAPDPLPLPDFITSFVPWKRENAVALLDYLEDRWSRSWMRSVASAWDVSEYVLYGRFVLDVLGDAAGQYETQISLCRDYWEREPLSEPDVEELLDAVEGDEIAVSITAKAGMPAHSYAPILERRWSQYQGRSID